MQENKFKLSMGYEGLTILVRDSAGSYVPTTMRDFLNDVGITQEKFMEQMNLLFATKEYTLSSDIAITEEAIATEP